jgi:hypothetical protein
MPKKSAYDREKAVAYAHAWAYGRNPAYYNYDSLGGDCTNFVSQCLYAGAGVMNYDGLKGWYYNGANSKSPSWTGVEFLRNFLVRDTDSVGPYAAEVGFDDIMPGDVIQMAFDGGTFQHSLFVVEVGEKKNAGVVLVASHSDDQDDNPLNTYEYRKIRYLHILGVR